MNEKLKAELSKAELTPMHSKLLDHVNSLVTMSRNSMSRHYSDWDSLKDVYDSKRDADKQDRKTAAKGSPTKITVPLTYAQVNTFVALMFMLYHQRERFFELAAAGGVEDEVLSELSEKLLNGDLKANNFSLILYQHLLDVGRFGVGVFKSCWTVESSTFLKQGVESEFDGITTASTTLFETVTTFEGTKIYSVSPYNFFPDTRLPLTRFQEGEFCASEEEVPRHKLKSMEADGTVAGIEHVDKFDTKSITSRSDVSRFRTIDFSNHQSLDNTVCVTEIQVKIVPDQYKMEDGTALANTSKPITCMVWVANDQRIIKIEPLNYYHGQFTYDVAQFSPDQHNQLSESLTSKICNLQEITDWFYNSRVASVHRTLDNQLVVDPSVVDMSTVTNSSRVIKLRRGAPKVGISRFIQPLPVVDVTSNHMDDVNRTSNIIDTVTGINQTAQGQFHTGRRSATEARGAISGAASRLGLYGKLIWEGSLAPLGKKIVINSRQSLSQEGFQISVGDNQEQLAMFDAYKSDAYQLVRKADFFVYDGTLPSEKQFTAQSLQELLSIVVSSPELAAQMQIDVKKLISEIYELRGIRNISRFKMSPEELQQIQQQQMMMMMAQQAGQPQPQQQQ
jgi:hypothetical protein